PPVPQQNAEEPEPSERVLQERAREIWAHSWTDGAQEEPDPAGQFTKLAQSLGIPTPHATRATRVAEAGDTRGGPRRSVGISRNARHRANTLRIAGIAMGAIAAMLVTIAIIPTDWTASIRSR